jgi:hypothetical protein
VLVAVLVVAPLATPIVLAMRDGGLPGLDVPVEQSMIYREASHRMDKLKEGHDGITGLVAVLLALGLLRRQPWIAGGVGIAAWFSLGVRFGPDGGMLTNAPYAWLYGKSDFVSRLNFPERAMSVGWCLLAVAILVALGRTRVRSLAWLFVAVGLLERVHDGKLPLVPVDASELPAARLLALHPGPVLSVPANAADGLLVQQVYHRQPLVSGMADHEPTIRPAAFSARVANNPFFAALVATADESPAPWRPEHVDEVKTWVRWVWLDYGLAVRTHGATTADSTLGRVRAYLGEPYYGDHDTYTWDLRRQGAVATEAEVAIVEELRERRDARTWMFPRTVLESEAGAAAADDDDDDGGEGEGGDDEGEDGDDGGAVDGRDQPP